MKSIKEQEEDLRLILETEISCGDSSCYFQSNKSKGGLHTNGGCRCLQEVRPFGSRAAFHRAMNITRNSTPDLLAWAKKARELLLISVESSGWLPNGDERVKQLLSELPE